VSERERLEGIAADSWYADWVNASTIRYSGKIFARHWHGGRCLELGPAEGLMTAQLIEAFDDVVAVDGSERFCELLRQRYPTLEVVEALFEDFEPQGQFDAIVLGHVLEHVADPVSLLKRAAGWLASEGAIFAAVPNAKSLHREAAVIMGLLQSQHEFTDADRHHGHRRIYEPETLRADFVAAGLTVEAFGGYWLKPVSMAQIERDWTPEMLDAFMVLGERYPDIAAEIYVVAAPRH
jgi:2-polyprenyl-3-methyl-5-hydroxy-6-metoxy-1,4-benzoquinol methylase